MKRKLRGFIAVSAAMLGCWGGSAWAQDLADGSYYIKNVKTGQFLVAGNAWGTQASLGRHGLDFTLTKLPEGSYTLDSQISNGGDNHFLGDNGFVDSPAANMTIVGDGNGIYTITADGTNYLSSNADNTVVAFNATVEDEYAQWQFFTRDDMFALLDEATPENPVDATFFVKGQNFSRNDGQRNSAWTGSPAIGGANENHCAEKYNCAFDVYQNVTGVPAGKYKLYCQGFFRYGLPAAALAAHIDGTEVLETKLYANDSEAPLMSIFNEEALTVIKDQEITGGRWSTGTINGEEYRYPDDMTSASVAFSAGLYQTSLDVVVGETGAIKMGFKKETGDVPGGNWTIFDNFEIYYLGLDEDAIVAAKATIEKLKAEAELLYDQPVEASLLDNLKEVVAKSDLSETPKASEIAQKTTELTEAIAAVKTYIAAYEELANMLAEAETFDANRVEASLFDHLKEVAAGIELSEISNAADLARATEELKAALDPVRSYVAAYESLKATIDKAKEIVNSVYVYNEEDKAVYMEAIADAEIVYEDLAYDNPSELDGIKKQLWNTDWKSGQLLARPFISSIWSTDDAVYTNNWSTEADNKTNGSGMTTPFIEYWTGDGNSLGAKEIKAELSGLEAGDYKVSALVRVRMKNGETGDAHGIIMTANTAEVDVCNGKTCEDGEQFRYDVYSVDCTVAEDGNLTIAFNVAEENNISWLAFKEVKFEKKAVYDLVPTEVDPAPETSIEELGIITFTFPAKIANVVEDKVAECTLRNLLTGEEYYLMPNDAYGDLHQIGFFAFNEEYEPITEPGTYVLTVSAGVFGDADYINGKGGHANSELVYRFYVEAPVKPIEATILPAEGEVTSLEQFIIEFDRDVNINWNCSETINLVDSEGNVVASATGDDCETDFDNWCRVIVNLNTSVVAEGTYTLVIPAERFELGEQGNAYNNRMDYCYVIVSGGGDGIDVVLAGNTVADVYTINGVLVVKNADREALKALKKGVYIINGKKVIMK